MTPLESNLSLFGVLEREEEWIVIEEFPNYAVSSIGRVKRLTSRTRAKAGSILKYHFSIGYPLVTLCHPSKKTKQQLVHRLVAAAFLPKIEGKNEVNHLDGNRGNPCLTNLEYVSRSENALHAHRTGLQKMTSEGAPNVKLTREQVAAIRAIGYSRPYKETAAKFGITYSNVGRIVRMETWVDADCPTKMVVSRVSPPKPKPRFAIHIRRAKKRGSEVRSSHEKLEQKLDYYDHKCRYCKCPLDKSNVSFDHAIPLSRGGTSWTSNYMPCCRRCNSSKKDKTIWEYLDWLREKRKVPMFAVDPAAGPDATTIQ